MTRIIRLFIGYWVRLFIGYWVRRRYVCYPGLDEAKLKEALDILSRDDGSGAREAEHLVGKQRLQQGSKMD